MINILQVIYISVGLITLCAISVFTLINIFSWSVDIWDRFRKPYLEYYYSKLFSDLETSFYADKKLVYIFRELKKIQLRGMGLDVWKFRNEVEEKFGRS